MEAKLVDRLPEGEGWQFEPKWDGFRCLAFRDGESIALHAKSGKPLARYFPDVVAMLRASPVRRFVLDGELVIPVGNTLSFDALQLRLHPAESRVRRLADETPAVFIVFDLLLTPDNRSLLGDPFRERRRKLEELFPRLAVGGLRLSPYTRAAPQARRWLERVGAALDGVIAKELAAPYQPGERAMLKVKCLRTADCVVGGFRYAQGSREVGSLLLGLYDDDGNLNHVGFTSSIAQAGREKLTAKLERLRQAPGFTGRAPGGPSRWSTERSGEWEPLKPTLIAEVQYDHVTGDRFRHGTKFLRWRPDKSPRQCSLDQLVREKRPAKLMADILKPRAARKA